MKMNKKLLVLLSASTVALTLASCGSEAVNQVVPYGSLAQALDKNVATANNDLSMTLKQYYNRLRSKGYDVFTSKVNQALYKNEFEALKNVLAAKSLDALGDKKEATVKALTLIDEHDEKLFEVTAEKYVELRQKLLESINTSLGSAVFGSASEETITNMTEKERNKKIAQFVDTQAQSGVAITADDIKWFGKANANYELDADSKLIQFEDSTITKLSNTVETYLLSQAEKLSAKQGLIKVADKEYVYDEDKEDDVKNTNYVFEEDDIKSTYNSTYKTYGTYNAISIKFNTLKEAMNAINKVSTTGKLSNDKDEAKAQYIAIYNDYYAFKEEISAPISYKVNKKVNELSDLNSNVATLIKDTLEDNEYLVEPRNMGDSYFLVYKFDTEYEIHGDEASEEVEFAKLSDADKAKYTALVKEDILDSSASAYVSTNKQTLLKESNLEIYDPLFETKFYYSNSDDYERITTTVSQTYDLIFKTSNFEYSIQDFYKDASDKYGSSILTDHFTLEYTYSYYDTYVNDYYIAKDLHDTNVEKLDADIETFKAGNATAYPANSGLEVYLLGTYGYDNKEDVIKYYYDAAQARTTYTAKKVYTEWGNDENSIVDSAKTGFLSKLLETGNNYYSKIFDINLDHILINIDDDGDGSPDDPTEFINKYPESAEAFKAAVVELAKAIYLEAINDEYDDNSLYKILTHIKSEFEHGAALKSDPTKTWDDFKTFNFQLTVEQLASSSNITESSVSNYVEPFKKYVENMYKLVSVDSGESKANTNYDDGIFYFVYNDQEGNLTGHTASTVEQADLVTYDSLCQTSFGYHMLVLNSYSKPRSTKSTKSGDSTGSLANIKVTLHKYTDSDDVEHNIYVTTDAYNEDSESSASFNQFFIYYVQKQNGDSSSLESTITTILGRMFDQAISTFSSTNFQNYLLFKTLNIKVANIENFGLKELYVNAAINYCEHTLISYDEESDYVDWLIVNDEDLAVWARPDAKK